MKDVALNQMNETEQKIVEGAIKCFVHFGARKTSMNDIAREAGVSRQTLYDLFGGKDDLIRASILRVTDMSIAEIERQLSSCQSLEDKIALYLRETTLKSFELLQLARDPEDLIRGHNEAGAAAIRESQDRLRRLVSGILSGHENQQSEVSNHSLATFIVTVSMNFKYVKNRNELEDLLKVLRLSVSALA